MNFIVMLSVECFILITFNTAKNRTRGAVADAGHHYGSFPKHYACPPRWLRKFFKLKKEYIPRCLIFEFYVSLVIFSMLFVLPVAWACTKFDDKTAWTVLWIDLGVGVFHALHWLVMSIIFWRIKKKMQKNSKGRRK